MRKNIALFIALAVFLAGCAPLPSGQKPLESTNDINQQKEENNAEENTIAANEENKTLQVLCVMDWPISMDEDFFNGVEEKAITYGWKLTKAAQDGGFEAPVNAQDYDGILALRTQAQTSLTPLSRAALNGTKVALIDLTGALPTPGISTATYKQVENIQEYILDGAIAYPPHDTPVRLIGIFKEKGSRADEAYKKKVDEGKIFSRATFYRQENSQATQEFIEKQLDNWIVGTLDAWYVEDIDTAKLLINILETHNRDDGEVFVATASSMWQQKQMYKRYVFPMAFGADIYFEAKLQCDELNNLFLGKSPVMRQFKTTMFFLD